MKTLTEKIVMKLLVLCALLGLPWGADAGALDYRIRDLGKITGTISGVSINNRCQLVLSSSEARFILNSDGSRTPFPAALAWGSAINDSGVVVGCSADSAATWSAAGGLTLLDTLPGQQYGMGFAINNSGQVVGRCETPYQSPVACLWDTDGSVTALAPLPGHTNAWASCITESGLVAGASWADGGKWSSCIWDAAGNATAMPGSGICALSDNGWMALIGVGSDGDRLWTGGPYLWSEATGPVDLRMMGGQVVDVNDSGLAVGFDGSPYSSTDRTAFAWTQATGVIRLPGLRYGENECAWSVNESGVIAGWARDIFGKDHAVIWEPVPEPSSWLVLLCGLGGVAGSWRRRHP